MASRLIQCCLEYRPQSESGLIGRERRGIYVLYKQVSPTHFEVRYIGMTTSSIRGRLAKHKRNKQKRTEWTHFSAFAVWPNITEDEIRELEGLFRHIFKKDEETIVLNLHRGFKGLKRARDSAEWREWTDTPFKKVKRGRK